MGKILIKLLISFVILYPFSASSSGIKYTGVKCANQDRRSDITATNEIIDIEIIIKNRLPGRNILLVTIHGGIPRTDAGGNVRCIEQKLAFGHSEPKNVKISDENNIITPIENESIDGIAIWDGNELIVNFSAFYYAKEPILDNILTSSFIFPLSSTLIFNYEKGFNKFHLREMILSSASLNNISANTSRSLTRTEPTFYRDIIELPVYEVRQVNSAIFEVFE